jgi:hypothetical protein
MRGAPVRAIQELAGHQEFCDAICISAAYGGKNGELCQTSQYLRSLTADPLKPSCAFSAVCFGSIHEVRRFTERECPKRRRGKLLSCARLFERTNGFVDTLRGQLEGSEVHRYADAGAQF